MAKAPDEYKDALTRRGFELSDWLGGGAYGNVYKARQTSLNRTVAVKFFEDRFAKAESMNKRARREPLLLARVEHPAIPYVITQGSVKGGDHPIPYTVMQYVAGPTLEQRMRTSAMSEADIHRIMRDLLSALQLVHHNGVIHRDVKPANIIVSNHGTFLLDFSIGVSLEHEPGLTRTTKMAERVGTHDYAAPEQMADSSTVNHLADIYSAAVVLAEMLGARPRLDLGRLDLELERIPENPRYRAVRGGRQARRQVQDRRGVSRIVRGCHGIGLRWDLRRSDRPMPEPEVRSADSVQRWGWALLLRAQRRRSDLRSVLQLRDGVHQGVPEVQPAAPARDRLAGVEVG